MGNCDCLSENWNSQIELLNIKSMMEWMIFTIQLKKGVYSELESIKKFFDLVKVFNIKDHNLIRLIMP